MNKILGKVILFSMAACCLPFWACSEDDPVSSETNGTENLNHVNLIPTQTEGNIEIMQDGIVVLDAEDVITLFPVTCSEPMTEDTEISLKVKPISVDLYNVYHDTHYKQFKNVELLTPRILIKKGEKQSDEKVRLRITDMSGLYDGMDNHMVPIALDSMPETFAEGERAEMLVNFRKKFLPNAISAVNDIPEYGLSYTEGQLDNLKEEIVLNNVIKSDKNAQDNINVTVAIDESLVEKYNKENSTSYKTFPNASLKSTQVKIEMGSMGGNVELSFKDKMASVKYGEQYMIPVVIKQVEGGGAFIGEEAVAYIKFTSKYVFGVEVRDELVGTKMTNFAAWTVTVDGKEDNAGLPWGWLLYGYDIGAINPGQALVVDMGEKKTVKSIHWRSYSDYTFTQITIGVSNDGISYKERPIKIDNPQKRENFVFVSPTEARYIRIMSEQITYPANLEIYE